MRRLFPAAAVSILIAGAPSTSRTQAVVQEEVVTPFWTLDWTFDTGALSGEYAIERIRTLRIGPNDELIIVDNDAIKVFDRNMSPICILRDASGSPVASHLMGPIGRTGHLMIIEHDSRAVFGHQFGPGWEYIRTREYPYPALWDDQASALGLGLGFLPRTIISFSEDQHVFSVDGAERQNQRRRDSPVQRWEALIQEKDGTYEVITAHERADTIPLGNGNSLGVGQLGRLEYQALPERRIVFTHSAHDHGIESDRSVYTMHILSLDDGTVIDITHPYTPEPLTAEEMIEIALQIRGDRFDPDDPDNRERFAPFYEVAERHPFKAPVSRLYTDREYIFVMTYTKDDAGGILTHVFDADGASYLRSTVRPRFSDSAWRIEGISNGYAYVVCDWMGVDGPPRIERYRLNPAIYVK